MSSKTTSAWLLPVGFIVDDDGKSYTARCASCHTKLAVATSERRALDFADMSRAAYPCCEAAT